MIHVRSHMRRGETVVVAVVLAFGVVAWEQWVHAVALGVHDNSASGFVAHWIRDGALAMVPAVLAVSGGIWLSARLRRARPETNVFLARPALIALFFAVLLVPLVAVHTAIDGVVGGDGGLGTIKPAPGAGYLLAGGSGGLESAGGFFGQLAHGARDALIAAPVALALAMIAISAIAWRTAGGVARSAVVTPARATAMDVGLGGGLTITKRELLKYSGAGAAALAVGSTGLIVLPASRAHAAEPGEATPWLSENIELFVNDGIIDTIEGTPIYSWGWGFRSGGVDESGSLNVPGPVLWTNFGETVTLSVTNNLDEDHSFVIEGAGVDTLIAPGDTELITFAAPSPGTYLYQDGLNRPVNRVLGLHGVLIVMPASGDLVAHPDLDAEHWTFVTQWVWVFNEIDPAFNARAQAGLPIDPVDFIDRFLPRYFTLNGRMGSLASHEETAPDTVIHDEIGNPALIRIVNAGAAMHGPHFHGNHVYPLLHNAQIPDVIMWKDTLRVMPEDRVDTFLPFRIPPNAVHFPPPEEGSALLEELHGRKMEGKWPMHCHVEMSQTAAGGLYPQGLLTDWKVEL